MKSTEVKRLTIRAFFIALVALLGLTPLGLIPLGFINVTVLCIPVITGALYMGLRGGLLLGFAFGTVSMMSMLGLSLTQPSMLASTLFASSPVLALVMCYLPRLMVPLAALFVYKRLHNKAIAVPAAALVGSLTNTVLYLGLMLLFYILCGLNAKPIIGLILGTGILGGGSEAVVAALLVPPILAAVRKID